MFLDKYGIKLYILDDFLINPCGVEDSVKNYQTYFGFMLCSYGVRVQLQNPFFFFLSLKS